MKNRVSTKPNRVAVYDDAYNFLRHEYHERADEPTEIGDALDKANLLPDATCDLLGIARTSVPKDAFNKLSMLTQYWWSKKLIAYRLKQADSSSTTLVSTTTNRTISYSATVSINQSTGAISLVNPSTVTINTNSSSSTCNVLKGKYFTNAASAPTDIRFAESGAVLSGGSGEGSIVMTLTHVITAAKYYEAPTYISSAAADTYPASQEVDGYLYTSIGKAIDKAICGASIDSGSYIGTGLFGSSNLNSVTCSFKPKMLMLEGLSVNGAHVTATIPIPMEDDRYAGSWRCYTTNNAYIYAIYCKVVGNTIYWYAESARVQFNESGEIYYFTVIG